MYGTIARLKITPGKLDAFMELGASINAETNPGIVFQHVYHSDTDPNEYWLVVGFTSREAYTRNAASPEQHQQYLSLRSLLDADPEWHDGEVLSSVNRS